MATVMGEKLGVEPHVVEAALNHVSGPNSGKAGVGAVYNRSTYFEKRKIAHALWAEHVQSVIDGTAAKIVPLRTKVPT